MSNPALELKGDFHCPSFSFLISKGLSMNNFVSKDKSSSDDEFSQHAEAKIKKKPLRKRLRNCFIIFIIGAIIGVVGILAVQNYYSKYSSTVNGSTSVESVSIVFSRIVDQNEMVTASQDYMLVEKSSDTNRLFDIIDIPFTENSFWYRFVGQIKAGVALGNASYELKGDVITVTLYDPYIISNTPNTDETGVLEENDNILNPIHVEDVDELQKECIKQSEQSAIEGGLLDEAKANAENNIRGMFAVAFGDAYTVEFNWISNENNNK